MTSMKTHPELTTKPVVAIAPQSVSAGGNVASAEIDILGFDGFLLVPSMGVGDTALAFTMTESAESGGTFTAVNDEEDTPAAVSIPFTATDDGTLKAGFFRSDRRERYIIVDVDGTGGSGSLCQAVVILINARDSVYQDVTYTYKL